MEATQIDPIAGDTRFSREPVDTTSFEKFLKTLQNTETWKQTTTGSGEEIHWDEKLARKAFDRGGKFFVVTYKDLEDSERKIFMRETNLSCCDVYDKNPDQNDAKILRAVGKTDNSSIATPYNKDGGENPLLRLKERIKEEVGLSKGQYTIGLVNDKETDYQTSKDMPLPTKFNIVRHRVVINGDVVKGEYTSTSKKHPVTLRWE